MRLEQLQKNRQGTIVEILGEDSLAVRLMEMGLVTGTPVEFIRSGPLGDPLEFRVRGYHLSLRRLEARDIVIALDKTAAPLTNI